jgi:D-alanyl-D-alanine carboxypeptidase
VRRAAWWFVPIAAILVAACSSDRESAAGDDASRAGDVGAAVDSARDSGQVHPRFDLSLEELESICAGLPVDTATAILARPEEFLELVLLLSDAPPELLWRVDRQHPAPEGYEPSDLVELDSYADRFDLSREGHRLRGVALEDFRRMVDAARADGVTLLVSSVYRSYDYQAGVYEYWVETLGQEEADRVSARPGTSQHQLGTTIDFGCICDEFADTVASDWLIEHAWEYGFSLSYPEGLEELTGYSHESWHYRYMGPSALQLEREFFGNVQHHLLVFARNELPVIMASLIQS